MSLPKKTFPEFKLVTMRSRLLTSLRLAAGLPGGSVQTSVTRNGWLVVADDRETKRVWLWPVARASAGLSSKTCMGAAAWTKELERPTGRLLVRLIKPHPWELVGLLTWRTGGEARERAPLIKSAFIKAGLLVRPNLWKNSCMRASTPETSAAARLVPDS